MSLLSALGACRSAPLQAQPGDAGSDDAASLAMSVPPIEGTLVNDTWRLVVRFDPRAPTATLSIRQQPYVLENVTLTLQGQEVDGVVQRDGGAVPAHAKVRYRLAFALDECEHEPPTPPGRWPGLCGYPEGGVRPRRATRYDLLIDVDSRYWPAQELHQFEAACVPSSGAGPSCQLLGVGVPKSPADY